jgi:hypothetical protein
MLLFAVIGISALITFFVALIRGAKRDTTFVSHLRRGFLAAIITVLSLGFISTVYLWFADVLTPDIPGMALLLMGIPVYLCEIIVVLLVFSARNRYERGRPSMLLKRTFYH